MAPAVRGARAPRAPAGGRKPGCGVGSSPKEAVEPWREMFPANPDWFLMGLCHFRHNLRVGFWEKWLEMGKFEAQLEGDLDTGLRPQSSLSAPRGADWSLGLDTVGAFGARWEECGHSPRPRGRGARGRGRGPEARGIQFDVWEEYSPRSSRLRRDRLARTGYRRRLRRTLGGVRPLPIASRRWGPWPRPRALGGPRHPVCALGAVVPSYAGAPTAQTGCPGALGGERPLPTPSRAWGPWPQPGALRGARHPV